MNIDFKAGTASCFPNASRYTYDNSSSFSYFRTLQSWEYRNMQAAMKARVLSYGMKTKRASYDTPEQWMETRDCSKQTNEKIGRRKGARRTNGKMKRKSKGGGREGKSRTVQRWATLARREKCENKVQRGGERGTKNRVPVRFAAKREMEKKKGETSVNAPNVRHVHVYA